MDSVEQKDETRPLRKCDNWDIAWSPNSPPLTSIMDNVISTLNETANVTFKSKPFPNKKKLYDALTSRVSDDMGNTLAGIAFDDSIKEKQSFPNNIQMTFRFPAELRFKGNENDWHTGVLFPVYQVPGPRERFFNEGGIPSYWYEGFLLLQHVISSKIFEYLVNNSSINLPEIFLQRFPYPEYTQDDMLDALKRNVPLLMMKFKKKIAVKDLTLNMYEGHITVLLGHNGAGKTTTMSMLTGMITPTSGTALIGGYDVRTDIHMVRESLGLCPQHNVLFEDLTVREHLYFFGKMKGLSGTALETEIRKYVSLLDLEPKEHSQCQTLSGGMQRKLAAGVALCGGSKIVLFDEPTSGLDPAARRALWDLLQAEKEGRTILLTTHFMDEADLLGDRIAIMADGELQCCGSSFFLKKKYGKSVLFNRDCAGYHLIIVKGSNCNVDSVTRLLQEYIPDLVVDQNIGSELSYLLNEDQSSVFEGMLAKLEENKNKLGLLSYGVSLTTMEEVFMKVGKDVERNHTEEHHQSNGIDNVVYSGSVEIDDSSILPNETKCYWYEGFLLLQHVISSKIFEYLVNNSSINLPEIFLQRFPYPEYTQDDMLDALKRNVPLLMMVSFVYTCINTVKVITVEKERQLKARRQYVIWQTYKKEFMLLSTMLHHRCFITLGSRLNTGWIFPVPPMEAMLRFMEHKIYYYEKLYIVSDSGILMLMFLFCFPPHHQTGEGMQWYTVWTPVTKDDKLVLGHVMVMLLADAIIYLLIALYVEAIYPGEYGVPKPWYFPFKVSILRILLFFMVVELGLSRRELRVLLTLNKNCSFQLSYWCGDKSTIPYFETMGQTADINNPDVYETEPSYLPAGIQIKHLRKMKGLSGTALETEIRKYVSLLDLEPKEHSQCQTLSGGMQRKLAAGVALCGGSKVSSRRMEECEALCTRLAIMVNGQFKCIGSTQHLKNKFAKGYTLIVKVKKTPVSPANGNASNNHVPVLSRDNETYDLQPVKEFIARSFPGAIQMEEYQGLLTYCISNPTITWSKMFGIMEKAKRELNIEDYSLGQTSLEQ
ncbi:hypothetical protein ANN_06075, partial [Periplaneta americana]